MGHFVKGFGQFSHFALFSDIGTDNQISLCNRLGRLHQRINRAGDLFGDRAREKHRQDAYQQESNGDIADMLQQQPLDKRFGHADPDKTHCAVLNRHEDVMDSAFIRNKQFDLFGRRHRRCVKRKDCLRNPALKRMREQTLSCIKNHDVTDIFAACCGLRNQFVQLIKVIQQYDVAAT